MKCLDCARSVLRRPEIRQRAIEWAGDIKREADGDRQAFACFGLLLMAELLLRCDACAPIRVLAGAELVAAGVGYERAPKASGPG